MTKYGYARASHLEPADALDLQVRLLEAAGCAKVYRDMAGLQADCERAEWKALCDLVEEGDCVLISKIDRAASSLQDFTALLERLDTRGVTLQLVRPAQAAAVPVGGLTVLPDMVRAWAEFERDIMAERKRVGLSAGIHLQR